MNGIAMSIKESKKIIKKEGYSVYMGTTYCKQHTKTHTCDQCEYYNVCEKIIVQILINSVNIIKDLILNNEFSEDECQQLSANFNGQKYINSNECKSHRNVDKSCKKCKNEGECYLYVFSVYQSLKILENEENI